MNDLSKINGGVLMLPSSVDLLAFMGQSNMAGRGVAAQAPAVPEGHPEHPAGLEQAHTPVST